MSDAHHKYTAQQLDAIQRFNAAIRESPSELAAPLGSAWMTWHIRYTENHEPLRYLSQTVKARNQNEAERKAAKLLSGRHGLWQVVLPLEPCGDCDPCCGGRPDQCVICPTPNDQAQRPGTRDAGPT